MTRGLRRLRWEASPPADVHIAGLEGPREGLLSVSGYHICARSHLGYDNILTEGWSPRDFIQGAGLTRGPRNS